MSADAAFAEGNRLRDLGQADAAVAAYRRCLALRPDHAEARRNLLVAILYATEISSAERFAEHLAFGRNLECLAPVADVHLCTPEPERPLNIGYLSSNFVNHPVGRAIRPLFENRDHSAFKVHCYAEVDAPDALSAELRGLADGWRCTVGRSDAEVARMILSDRIDILICLAGHLDRNRMSVCAHRPAPIQVSYHDASTSGLAAMDYLLADRFLVPRHGPERFTERVVRLPSLIFVPPPADAPSPNRRPAGAAVVFGGFNAPAKTSAETLDLWAGILRRVDGASLLLKWRDAYGDPDLQRELYRFFSARGIAADRLDLRGGTEGNPLAVYHDVDITLDPHPISGSTVSFESLWMGVPVITWPGDTMIGRWTAAMLPFLGLGHLVTGSGDDTIAQAAALAAQPDIRARLRESLRGCVGRSALCDGVARTRQIERLFRAFWRRWCELRP